MIYALSQDGRKVVARPGQTATCPLCRGEVLAKCGRIKVWHWAHRSLTDCDTWSEGESPWHAYWKRLVPAEMTEVTIVRDGIRRRADILLPGGTVLKLQASSISVEEIEDRERFYGDMLWLFNVRECASPVNPQILIRPRQGYYSFRWKHPRKHVAFTMAPTYLDLGPRGIMRLKRMHPQAPCGGWGYIRDHARFEAWLRRSARFEHRQAA